MGRHLLSRPRQQLTAQNFFFKIQCLKYEISRFKISSLFFSSKEQSCSTTSKRRLCNDTDGHAIEKQKKKKKKKTIFHKLFRGMRQRCCQFFSTTIYFLH